MKRKVDISNIENGESVKALRNFIDGERNYETAWCDWKIPLHWGGVSDPFQPIERERHKSLDALKVFAETQYPFIVSTKSDLIAHEPYLSLIKQCNCVVQFSAVCPEYDILEKGASSFSERMKAAEIISKYKRVNVRVQPYMSKLFEKTKACIRTFYDAGVHGCIYESMKYQKPIDGTIRIGNDFVYPVENLRREYSVLRDILHKYGMKFYCGENRLRGMGDELCCCGIDGLGWRVNTANLNHYIYDKDGYKFTQRMNEVGTARPFEVIHQSAGISRALRSKTYEEMMHYEENVSIKQLIPEDVRMKKPKR